MAHVVDLANHIASDLAIPDLTRVMVRIAQIIPSLKLIMPYIELSLSI
jgi:hypothetical protein